MAQFDLYGFQVVMYRLQHEEAQAHIVVHCDNGPGGASRAAEVPTDDVQLRIKGYLADLRTFMDKFGCTELGPNFDRVFNNFEVPGGIKYVDLESQLQRLRESVQDYLSRPVLILLSNPEGYTKSSLFGVSVEQKFPSLAVEISEAGKCLALGRATASAFHSLRCLEVGLRALHACLGLPPPTTGSGWNWGNMLTDIKRCVDTRWPDKRSRFNGDGEFFDGIYGMIDALKDPYRNSTMHFGHNYNIDQARLLFNMVGGIMDRISARMDENGNPRA